MDLNDLKQIVTGWGSAILALVAGVWIYLFTVNLLAAITAILSIFGSLGGLPVLLEAFKPKPELKVIEHKVSVQSPSPMEAPFSELKMTVKNVGNGPATDTSFSFVIVKNEEIKASGGQSLMFTNSKIFPAGTKIPTYSYFGDLPEGKYDLIVDFKSQEGNWKFHEKNFNLQIEYPTH